VEGLKASLTSGGRALQETASHRSWPYEIVLSGITLSLSLNNSLRTYLYEVMLYVIPTYLNLSDEFQHRDAEVLELNLQVTAQDLGVTVDPRQLVLTLDNKPFRPTGVWVNNLERERQIFDAYVKTRRRNRQDQPPPLPQPPEWRDAITAPVTVRQGQKSPRFIVKFPIPLQSPEKTVSLDITPAIADPPLSGFPLIRFQSRRWSEGYS